MKRVLFTATLVRGHIAKFHIPYLRWFKEQGWETWVAAHNDYPDGVCEIPYCDHYIDIPFSRGPYSFGKHVIALKNLKALLNDTYFDLIHTHTPVASVLTRLAARKTRKLGTKVFYTAHGFHFYTGAPILYWLLWYPVERLACRHIDLLITINQEDYQRARSFAHCEVDYLPSVGIDGHSLVQQADSPAKPQELGVPAGAKLVLGVGDLIPRKNFELLLHALVLLGEEYHVIICGEGYLYASLKNLAQELGVAQRFHLVGFRNDVPAIMAACHALVVPSIQEGLSCVVLEAMALGLPVIVSNIRGLGKDIVHHGTNGIVLQGSTPEEVSAAILSLEQDREWALGLTRAAALALDTHSIENILLRYADICQRCGIIRL